jgi:DNA-binding MarR family transcriptional regulator
MIEQVMTVTLPEPTNSRSLLPALADAPGHLAWRAHARVTAALGEVLPAGVDMHAYAVLLALAGGVTRSQQALSQTIAVSGTTLVKVAADLAQRGLVVRVRNPDDRRSNALTRTPEGAAAARSWRRFAEDLEDSITAGFSLAEREELRTLLLHVVESELAPDTPEPLRESIGFLITRVHFRMHRDFASALEPLGIEPRHFGVLTTLDSLGPITQSELGRTIGVSGASVVQMVDDLEARGLVARHRLETDRRVQVLDLLPGADDVRRRAHDLAQESLDHRLGGLTAKQTDRLVLLLQRFVTAP